MLSYTLKYHLRAGIIFDTMIVFMITMIGAMFNLQFNITLFVPLILQHTYLHPLKLTPAKTILIKITNANCIPLIRAAHTAWGIELLVAYIVGRLPSIMISLIFSRNIDWMRETMWLLQNMELNIAMLIVGIACQLSDLASIRNEIKRNIACYFLVSIAVMITFGLITFISFFDKTNIGLCILLLTTYAIWYCYTNTLKRLVYYIHFDQ